MFFLTKFSRFQEINEENFYLTYWLEELDEILNGSAAVVVLHLSAFTSWEEFEGGES